jgi:hypothetical protein
MKRILGQLAGASVVGVRCGLGFAARRVVHVPDIDAVPQGRILDLRGRGRTFVVDVPGPTPDAPTIVLLHALGCTASSRAGTGW